MSWLSKTFHRITHAITKPVKHIVKSVVRPVASVLGLGGGGVSYDSVPQQTIQVAAPTVAAPAVAAPEPTVGQEEQDLIKKKNKANKGKRALLIDTGGSGGTGGTTGTGLNL